MAITLDFPPEVEARLRALADARGQDLNTYAVAVLTQVADRAQADARDFEESCAAIAEALAEIEAGDPGASLEECRAEWEAQKAARKQRRVAAYRGMS